MLLKCQRTIDEYAKEQYKEEQSNKIVINADADSVQNNDDSIAMTTTTLHLTRAKFRENLNL